MYADGTYKAQMKTRSNQGTQGMSSPQYPYAVSLPEEVQAKRGEKAPLASELAPLYQLTRHRHWQRTNEWSSHGQAVQRESTWRSIARQRQSPWWYTVFLVIHRLEDSPVSWRVQRSVSALLLTKQLTRKQSYQYQVSWRVERPVDAIFPIDITDSNSHVGTHATTLCCLLPRAYGAWRAEPCQKHLQRLLPGLTERWVLWMWGRESRRFTKPGVSNAVAAIRRLSRLVTPLEQLIDSSTYREQGE